MHDLCSYVWHMLLMAQVRSVIPYLSGYRPKNLECSQFLPASLFKLRRIGINISVFIVYTVFEVQPHAWLREKAWAKVQWVSYGDKKQTNVQFMPATVSLAEIYSDSKKEMYYGQIFDRGKKKDWLKRDQSCSQVQCYYCLRDLSLLYWAYFVAISLIL